MARKALIERKTGETDISVEINLDGEGNYAINTGIGFLDHMLSLMCKHGFIDCTIKAKGDLDVDGHHTVEDIGICIGMALKKAFGDKKGMKRYETIFLPMDEALAMVSIDISGRPYIVFDYEFTCEKLGTLDTELVEEFFRAIAFNADITLQMKILYGKNNHHMVEALFKAFGRALCGASEIDERVKGIMSTKGIL